MTRALTILGMLWCLPVGLLCWVFYILPAWALGWLRFAGLAEFGVARFYVTDRGDWHRRRWAPWGGLALPYAIMLNTMLFEVELHELRHTKQWLLLGPLFPFVYLGGLIAAGGYAGNFLETDANRSMERELERRRRYASEQSGSI